MENAPYLRKGEFTSSKSSPIHTEVNTYVRHQVQVQAK